MVTDYRTRLTGRPVPHLAALAGARLGRLSSERRPYGRDADLNPCIASPRFHGHAHFPAEIIGNSAAGAAELLGSGTVVGVDGLEVVAVLFKRVPDG